MKRTVSGPADLHATRAMLDRPPPGPIPRHVRFSPAGDAPVPGEWVVSDTAPPDAPVLLYVHGGGFFACSPMTHRAVTSSFAHTGQFRVFAPDYRLAPEHRFPAAVDDVRAAYDWLVRTGNAPTAVAGDSAGGNLVLALLLGLRNDRRPMPAAGICFSPVTDLAATGASLVDNDRRDCMFHGKEVALLAGVYLPEGMDARDPAASPLYADFAGLPPLLLQVGEREVLRDDSVRLAARARAAGVTVELEVWPVVPHAWPVMGRWLPEARRAVSRALDFAARHGALAPVKA
jgi:monoterpene epsilon-lactone hydrolase